MSDRTNNSLYTSAMIVFIILCFHFSCIREKQKDIEKKLDILIENISPPKEPRPLKRGE